MQKESQESLRLILSVVRKTTRAIKLFPFLYIVLYLILLPFMAFGDIDMTEEISSMIYMSLVAIIFLVYLSYCVKLCKWHRLQCILPIIPQIVVVTDESVWEVDVNFALIFTIVYSLLIILSLINAYFVFIKPTQKRSTIIYQSSTP